MFGEWGNVTSAKRLLDGGGKSLPDPPIIPQRVSSEPGRGCACGANLHSKEGTMPHSSFTVFMASMRKESYL